MLASPASGAGPPRGARRSDGRVRCDSRSRPLRVRLQRRGVFGFLDAARRKGERTDDCVRLARFELIAVELQEHDGCRKRDALVAVDERVILCEAERVGRRQIENGDGGTFVGNRFSGRASAKSASG